MGENKVSGRRQGQYSIGIELVISERDSSSSAIEAGYV